MHFKNHQLKRDNRTNKWSNVKRKGCDNYTTSNEYVSQTNNKNQNIERGNRNEKHNKDNDQKNAGRVHPSHLAWWQTG